LTYPFIDQSRQIERINTHRNLSARSSGPFWWRTVDHQLKPVAVRIAHIDRDVHAVIGRAEQVVSRAQNPHDDLCQGLQVGQPKREMVQTSGVL
jgi:hypothetical protein